MIRRVVVPLGLLLTLAAAVGCQPRGDDREQPGAAPQTAPEVVPAAVPPEPGTEATGVAPDPLPMDTVGRVRTQGLGEDTITPPR